MKTLKNISRFELKWEDNRDKLELSLICPIELKQEAIKWIKEIKKIDNIREKDYQLANRIGLDGADLYCCPYILIRWIKHFFNITSEDLE